MHSYYVNDGGLIGILTSWLRRDDLNFDKKKKREIGFEGLCGLCSILIDYRIRELETSKESKPLLSQHWQKGSTFSFDIDLGRFTMLLFSSFVFLNTAIYHIFLAHIKL